MAPPDWARRAIALYHDLRADRVVAEVNYGGGMVEATIRMVDPGVPFTSVTASRGKVARAEPIAALYEQGRVHHLGSYPELEDQMCGFTTAFDRRTAGYSPGRVDALVWAVSELMVQPMKGYGIFELYRQMAGELATRETVRIEAPDPIQQRHEAILTERQRYAALMADRPPTPAEAAEHVAAIDNIMMGRHANA